MYTRVLPSISIDNGKLRHCSLDALAEVLDCISGNQRFAGIAAGLHLQKFWIILAESNVLMALDRHRGQPEGAKLALERRFGRLDDAKLALERRFGRPDGIEMAL